MAHAVLLDFIRAARGAGVRISTAETLDAMKAADLVGYGSRARLHAALAATLAKSADDRRLFDETFERFFSLPVPAAPGGQGAADSSNTGADQPPSNMDGGGRYGGGGGSSGGSDGMASGSGMAQPSSALGQMLMQGDDNAIAVAIARAAAASRLDNIRAFTQRGIFGRRLLQAMGSDDLDSEIIAAEDSRDAAQQRLGEELRRRRQLLRDEVRERVSRAYLLQAAQARRELREDVIRGASLATLDEFRDTERLVRKLARRLASQHSRRKRVEQRGLLDVRRTLARNVRHDGVMLEPQWRQKRIDRPNIIVVCDVSNSVRAYAKFLLLFLYSLADVLPRVRAFAFSFRLGEVTQAFKAMEFDDAVTHALREYGLGSTDYGLALETLEELCLDAVDNRTTVIFLGDARSNYSDPRADILKRFSDRARQVIWLNPEHPGRWGSGDSVMPRYKPLCTFGDSARTLGELEKVIARLLRRA